MKYTPRQAEINDNVTPTNPVKDLLVMAGGLLAVLVLVYLMLGLLVDLIAPRLSSQIELKMAGPILKMKAESPTDAEKTAWVQSFLDRMQTQCAHLPYDFRVHVLNDKTVNALALPGGHILVFTGLLDKISSENELAFVLAHELGHYANRDHLRGMGRALVFMTISAMVFGPDSRIGSLMAHGLGLTEMSFSRRQETRADEFALDMVNCFYGHVAGATDFFQRIAASVSPKVFGHYFDSHPENRRRIQHLTTLTARNRFQLGQKADLPPVIRSLAAVPGGTVSK